MGEGRESDGSDEAFEAADACGEGVGWEARAEHCFEGGGGGGGG